VRVYTIGFTQKTAEQFFSMLQESGVRCVIDVRLNNSSQLAGFAKRDDLRYFLRAVGSIDYIHEPLLAPTKDILSAYRKNEITWDEYEHAFNDLIEERQIEKKIDPSILDGGCLLCSEAEPHFCHRRLVAEYLNQVWGNIDVLHLSAK
jgi:uncharacterized protein (DUF488 family)